MANKKPKFGISLSTRISHAKFFGILTIAVVLAAIPLTVRLSQMQQNTQQHASVATSSACTALKGACINVFSQICNGTTKSGLCPGPASILCCIPKSIPVISKTEVQGRDIVTWTDGTKRAKVYLQAWAYDPARKTVAVAFRVRAQGVCTSPITSAWIQSNYGVYQFTAQGLQINKVYEFSAKAKNSAGIYSNGALFCGTDGWYPAKKFMVDSSYRLINL